jgi:hypothetical protein
MSISISILIDKLVAYVTSVQPNTLSIADGILQELL